MLRSDSAEPLIPIAYLIIAPNQQYKGKVNIRIIRSTTGRYTTPNNITKATAIVPKIANQVKIKLGKIKELKNPKKIKQDTGIELSIVIF
ncbi:MAG: hypothetical protein ABF670_08425, partial [Liquorilactobacillus ghanensis]